MIVSVGGYMVLLFSGEKFEILCGDLFLVPLVLFALGGVLGGPLEFESVGFILFLKILI